MNECISCLDSIQETNYYRTSDDSEWIITPYCTECISWMIENQWDDYVETIKKETCKKTLRRMLEKGPPLYVKEPITMPCDNHDGIYQFKLDGEIVSGELKDHYVGDQLEKYRKELLEYLQSLDN